MLKVQTPNGEDKVLLHSCCAPCSSAIIECMLENGIRPTVFYCNPNIYPQAEYESADNAHFLLFDIVTARTVMLFPLYQGNGPAQGFVFFS